MAFEGGFAGANAREEYAAQIFDVAVGGVERELGIVGTVAFPPGGGDLASFVVDEEAGVVAEEVDAVGAEPEAEVANVDIGQLFFAGFDGEGLALGLEIDPAFDAGPEAAPFGGQASLLPRVVRSRAEARGHGGIDAGVKDGGELFCINGGYDIVARVESGGIGWVKQAAHDFVKKIALFRWADTPLGFVEGLGAETFGGERLEWTSSLELEDVGPAGILLVWPGEGAGVVGNFVEFGLCGCGARY